MIQALLFYSAFAPFLVFAFLLNGVDLMSIAVILPGSVLTCAALSLVGIALSSLSRVRFLRILLMASFGAALLFVAIGTMVLCWALVQYPNTLRDRDAWMAISAYSVAALVIGGFAFATATARFAHDEENRSTAARVMTLVLIVATIGWAAWIVSTTGQSEMLWISQFGAAMVAFIPLMLFATEEETLRRHIAKRVPSNPVLAFLCSPFLPGGGRGVLFLGLLGLVALAAVPIVLSWMTVAGDDDYLETSTNVAVTYGFLVMHIALIGGLASFFVRTRASRTAVRWTIFASVPLALFVPALIGMFFGVHDWMQLDHPLNPVMVLDGVKKGFSINARTGIGVLAIAAIAAAMLNGPRALAGVREVLAASRARRAR